MWVTANSVLCIDIVRGKLILVTLGTSRVIIHSNSDRIKAHV